MKANYLINVFLTYSSQYLNGLLRNARTDFLTPDFFQNLAKLVKSVIVNRNRLLPLWDHLCFYLNIGILLCSSVWFDPSLHPVSKQNIIQVMSHIKSLLNEEPNPDFEAVKKLITFRWNVILLLSEFSPCSTGIFNRIVEFWLQNYFEDFEHFLESYRPTREQSSHTGLVLRNALTVSFYFYRKIIWLKIILKKTCLVVKLNLCFSQFLLAETRE